MDILVGSTGFVGGNLMRSHNFDFAYHSTDIHEAMGKNPDLLVYAGVPAEKFLANQSPEEDFAQIQRAITQIKGINPKKIVLMSTVDVYSDFQDTREEKLPDPKELQAYGANRLYLEQWVREECSDYHILRLPALFGENIKKNFIYDLIHLTPSRLKKEKFLELCEKDNFIADYYEEDSDGFYRCQDSKACRGYFQKADFSALHFTDSRSSYQFFPLSLLWEQILKAISENIPCLNLATAPILASELYFAIEGKVFTNEILEKPMAYDMKSQYFPDGYGWGKEEIMEKIIAFVAEKRA